MDLGQRVSLKSFYASLHALRPFGIASATIRDDEKTKKGYKAESFTDAWARYLPPPK